MHNKCLYITDHIITKGTNEKIPHSVITIRGMVTHFSCQLVYGHSQAKQMQMRITMGLKLLRAQKQINVLLLARAMVCWIQLLL